MFGKKDLAKGLSLIALSAGLAVGMFYKTSQYLHEGRKIQNEPRYSRFCNLRDVLYTDRGLNLHHGNGFDLGVSPAEERALSPKLREAYAELRQEYKGLLAEGMENEACKAAQRINNIYGASLLCYIGGIIAGGAGIIKGGQILVKSGQNPHQGFVLRSIGDRTD